MQNKESRDLQILTNQQVVFVASIHTSILFTILDAWDVINQSRALDTPLSKMMSQFVNISSNCLARWVT